MDAAVLLKRFEALKALRAPNEQHWRECYDYTYPLRGVGLNQTTVSDAVQAQVKKAQLLDGIGTDSARILASALMSGLTPANSRWFSLHVEQAGDEGDRWLDSAADTLWRNIHNANFDAAGFECALDMVCAGWFAMFIDEATEGGLQFEEWPLHQVYATSSRPGQPVDTVYRDFELTAEQAVTTYGIENLSEKSRKIAIDKPDEKIKFIHAIHPNRGKVAGAVASRNLPFSSCHLEQATKHPVRESGFHEFPVVVPRWMMIVGTPFSVGPAFDALPDLKMLNQLKVMELGAADLAIAGMWIAEDDGVINPRTVKVGPRKVIAAASVDSMKPLESGSDFNVAFTAEERLQASIRKVFMADQLQPQDGPAMTATEVHVRVQLIRQLLGPVYGRLQAEYLQPLIERCFGLAYRAGVFEQPPETIAGRSFTIKYISPIARAQSLEDVAAMDQYETVMINESQVRPEILDNYNWDEASRHRAKLLGVPQKLMLAGEDVARLRQSKQEAQQAQQEQELATQAVAQAAPKILERRAAA